MRKILILGGAGFIGLEIARSLSKKEGYDVTVADILSNKSQDDYLIKTIKDYPIKFIDCDLTDINSFDSFEKTYDNLYMLASVVGVNKCIKYPDEVIRINTSIIQNTLEWIQKNEIKKALFSSSSECYASTTDEFSYDVPTSEKVPLSIADIAHPRFTYAVTKMLGESAFLNFARVFNFEVSIVRYQNIFGPRMGFNHVIPHLVERFFNGNEDPFKIYGPEQTRAFCYITDAVIGTIMCMESNNSNQEIFHIGAPEEITVDKLVRSVGSIMNYKGSYIAAEAYPGSVSRRCPDISKATKFLGYEPMVKWIEGLKHTVNWYKEFFSSGKKIKDGGFSPPSKIL